MGLSLTTSNGVNNVLAKGVHQHLCSLRGVVVARVTGHWSHKEAVKILWYGE